MPRPQAGELLIQVHYIGINYADIIARRGYYKWIGKPPACPGFEVSGVVAEAGADTGIAPGTPVMAWTRFGGYAEYLCVSAERAQVLPPDMSLADAAAIPAVYATAYHCLHEVLRVRAGEDILIQAVAGGVGIAALQLCKHAGLEVYGTASTEEKLALARDHGLDHGINYRERDFEREVMRLTDGRGVRFVLDSLGGDGLRKGYRVLRSPGHLVTIGAAGVLPPQGLSLASAREWQRIASDLVRGGVYHPFSLIQHNRGISGTQILLLWDQLTYLQSLGDTIFSLYRQGVIKPFIHRIFPLAQAAQAHEFMEQRRSRGKLLLSPLSA